MYNDGIMELLTTLFYVIKASANILCFFLCYSKESTWYRVAIKDLIYSLCLCTVS